ncbi:MAG: hypothetical protein V7711_10770 [Pseudomonadales bacterium]
MNTLTRFFSQNLILTLRYTLGLALLVVPLFASADLREDGFYVELGYFDTRHDSHIRLNVGDVDLGLNLGTDIDLEDIGLKQTSSSGRLGLSWRFKKRHQLTIEHFRFHRGNRATLEKDISWEGITVEAGSFIGVNFDNDIYDISYAYSFIDTGKHHLAGSIGIYLARVELGLEASVGVTGEIIEDGEYRGSASTSRKLDAPLPLFGLVYDYSPTPNWMLTASGQYFGLDIGDLDGGAYNLSVDARYFFKHIYVGAGYGSFGLDVNARKQGFKGTIDWSYEGPRFYIGAKF